MMVRYASRTLIIHTVRGAAIWAAIWTGGTAALLAMRWEGRPVWPYLMAVLVPALVSTRILSALHRWESSRAPGEVEAFLFDLAVTVPPAMHVVVLALAKL